MYFDIVWNILARANETRPYQHHRTPEEFEKWGFELSDARQLKISSLQLRKNETLLLNYKDWFGSKSSKHVVYKLYRKYKNKENQHISYKTGDFQFGERRKQISSQKNDIQEIVYNF